ncbi:MAG: adenylosuccinate lyase [Candidatus Marinimicrobia bacterium]|nr:adenylosuccinate lyase [Candidatus Neomarinimicrobiota bacterium]
MIERYTLPEMGNIWSEENKFRTWLKVEVEVCRVYKDMGKLPEKDFRIIEEKANFNVDRIKQIEEEVRHDVIAFLSNVAEYVGPSSRFIHMGMTSSDLLDTALSLQIKEASELIQKRLNKLLEILKEKAFKYKNLIMIGRTHGIHAEPITFGLKFLIWYEELKRNIERFKLAVEQISFGKISGAVGTYFYIDHEVEKRVCKNLGLKPASISNQVLQRDRHAFFINTIALIGALLEKIALEIRHLQRTEVLEAEEPFGRRQKGSSAMPHKRNPVMCERICGLSRLLRGYSLTAMENIALWHERDISHSSTERVIIPDACIVIDFMLNDMIKILSGLAVYPENMKRNLNLTKGLIYSQGVLLKLVEAGFTREQAYEIVQKNAMEAWRTKKDFLELLLKDSNVRARIKKDELKEVFNESRILKKVDYIYENVLGNS